MKYFILIVTAFVLSGCLGMSATVAVKKDGSGTVNLVYRIAEDMLSRGSGVWDKPPVPLGKEDFERSVKRLPGISLTKFSEKTEGKDRLFLIGLAFDNLDALAAFFDSQGRQIRLEQEKDGPTILTVFLSLNTKDIDPAMIGLIPLVFDGYDFDFDITVPQKCEVSFVDINGNNVPSLPFGTTRITGDRAEFSSPMAELFTGNDAAAMVIRW
jgi:hypothetical protein